MNKYKIFITVMFTILLLGNISAQNNQKQYYVGCIAFYNLENLYDTINDPVKLDEEFTPEGVNKWTGDKYKEKLFDMADVISQIGTDLTPDGPAIMGFSEIENKTVVEDLVKQEKLKNRNYQVVQYDCPDLRGVDVALVYNPKYFTVTNSKSVRVINPNDPKWVTRDVLLVSGNFQGEPMHVLVNHWPSRRGGEKRSKAKRGYAATTCRKIIDSITALDANAKIIVMGDLNDNPNNQSIVKHLNANGIKTELTSGQLYNPFSEMYKKGIGSTAYQDTWSLFDQLIVSQTLLGDNKKDYKFFKAEIFNKKFLQQNAGRFEGYPFRTFVGNSYTGGYSDHFPSCIYLVKEK